MSRPTASVSSDHNLSGVVEEEEEVVVGGSGNGSGRTSPASLGADLPSPRDDAELSRQVVEAHAAVRRRGWRRWFSCPLQ